MSKKLHQLDLLSRPKPQPASVDVFGIMPTIVRRPTLLRAIHLAQEVSGLEDKQVYDALGIDASHWTRIKNGTAHFPADEQFLNFLNVVGNEIPLVWLAERRGYDWSTIRAHKSSVEIENETLKAKLAEQDRFIDRLIQHGARR